MATIPTYKKSKKITLACCRKVECSMLVDGKCTAITKEECDIEKGIEELSNYTYRFQAFSGWRKMNAYDYVTKYRSFDITTEPYTKVGCVSVIFATLRTCRREKKIADEKAAFWMEHEKERVWEQSYREIKGLGKYGYWLHEDTCYRCKHQFDGNCLKYSDERVCRAEEFCKEWGTELSKEGFRQACSLERHAEEERLRRIDDSTIEGYYASSALRGGWTGD